MIADFPPPVFGNVGVKAFDAWRVPCDPPVMGVVEEFLPDGLALVVQQVDARLFLGFSMA